MKKESQIAILKTIVKWQADEIEALQERVKALEQERDDALTGSVNGLDGTLTVTIPPQWEDTFDEPARTA